MSLPSRTIPTPIVKPVMANFSPLDVKTARVEIIRDLLTHPSLEVSAYPTLGHEDHLQIFLGDVRIWLAVIVDVPDLTAAVQAYLTEHFPGSTIPPLTVVRR